MFTSIYFFLIVDPWQYCLCFIRSGVTRCALLMVLYLDRMCQCGLHAVLWQGFLQLQAWVSTKWSPINSYFSKLILIIHQYSVSKIYFYHTILQDSIRRRPGLELLKALALVAHRYTYAPPRYRTLQYSRIFVPFSVSPWNDLANPVSVVWDWRVSRAGPMHLYWPKLLYPYYTLLLFFPFSSFCL